MTQKEKILRHLKDNKQITSWEAIMEYGVTRLSDVIYRLRNEGNNITMDRVTFVNRYGEKGNYGKYTLVEEQK